ncbi:MAG: DUF2076 domain-containing protein [Bradyrhizobiaceae bacterium]|nr:MAG: DUF2076 domain-containing protein [Bradyrhizobiaceae bacterium]
MNPQERQMIDELFDRLSSLETAPRDPDAESAIMAGLRRAPNAVYALVQTVLVQDEALRRANDHIEQLEGRAATQNQSGSFLDSMRSAFGLDQAQPRVQSRGSVPNVPPGTNRPVWNSGQVLGNGPASGGYADPRATNPGYGDPRGSMFGGPQPAGGGSSFLGTAAAAAAGVIGGSLLMNSIRGLGGGFGGGLGGGSQQSLASGGDRASPWGNSSDSNLSDSSLARDAGINDIGRTSGSDNRQPAFDQAQADAAQDAEQDRYDDQDNYAGGDFDDDDFDDGDFGGDDSSYA